MRLLIFFLLVSLGADAQIIKAEPFYRSLLRTDTLLLDSFPAAAGYSVRKLRTAYTGSCMRVRRTSNNNEQDIGFVNNYLDTASLKSFAGTSNLFVVTWYDQSGNGRNASNSTAAQQPKIYDSATSSITKRNEKVSLAPDGGDHFNITTGLNIFQNIGHINVFSIACNTSTSTFRYLVFATINGSTANARFIMDFNRTANRVGIGGRRLDADAFSSLISTSNYSTTDLQIHSASLQYSNSDAFVYRNGTQTASNTNFLTAGVTSNTSSDVFSIIGRSASGEDIIGSVCEIIIYNTDESANRVSIENNMNRNFSLY